MPEQKPVLLQDGAEVADGLLAEGPLRPMRPARREVAWLHSHELGL